ncbi:polypeptide N-acetylgalactosaminyltransferase 5 [Platysternon megacephalum]|uniref:Polypeptide N-acetylgalactosaminyltransferase 5 n=1 Tax=Platysternon megacephalum TaxID=55544 RepID=A0A4D9F5T9_9SAUR|nr:polypeptide N-acetylgalactosaminyltransferase 5 [Platysternon megacephalum]
MGRAQRSRWVPATTVAAGVWPGSQSPAAPSVVLKTGIGGGVLAPIPIDLGAPGAVARPVPVRNNVPGCCAALDGTKTGCYAVKNLGPICSHVFEPRSDVGCCGHSNSGCVSKLFSGALAIRNSLARPWNCIALKNELVQDQLIKRSG